jgi:cytochrome P450
MLRFIPTITARKAYQARSAFREAFRVYYAGGYNNASSFIQERVTTAKIAGLSQDDFLNVEVGMLFTASTNTAPSSFWFLCYILSSASLLAEVRAEISKIVMRKDVNGIDTLEMDTSDFQQHCPLLISSWEETLRLVDSSSSVRMVAKDTMLADVYLLKANSVVQMPSGTTHLSTEIWGPDAATFNPRRFLKTKSDEKLDAAGRGKRKLQVQGYFPFGGGKHLCPGRHFAFTEVMSLVATLVYGFDIRMADGSADFKAPRMALQKLGTGVRKPANDRDVLIKPSPGFEGAKWAYSVGKETDIRTPSTC